MFIEKDHRPYDSIKNQERGLNYNGNYLITRILDFFICCYYVLCHWLKVRVIPKKLYGSQLDKSYIDITRHIVQIGGYLVPIMSQQE